jgi:hypothetical protein
MMKRKTLAAICLTVLLALTLPVALAQAQFNGWVNIPFMLNAFNTEIQAANNWQIGSFSFNNAYQTTSLTFNQTLIGSGTPIPSLIISAQGANLTLQQLSLNETYFTFTANGAFTITLTGYGQAPSNAEIGTHTDSQTLSYNYITTNDTLILTPIYTGTEMIGLNLPENTGNPIPNFPAQTPAPIEPINPLLEAPKISSEEIFMILGVVAVILAAVAVAIYAKRKNS